MSKNMVDPEGPQMASQCGAYELRTGYARLHARTHRYVTLLSHGNSGYAKAPECFVIRTLPVLITYTFNPTIFIGTTLRTILYACII